MIEKEGFTFRQLSALRMAFNLNSDWTLGMSIEGRYGRVTETITIEKG